MSDCSTHAFEYPGMSRLIIRWTDQHERPHDWPFVTLGREVECVTVDGIEYVEVVGCRDCKHADWFAAIGVGSFKCRCHQWISDKPDGFCAWGVRKDD